MSRRRVAYWVVGVVLAANVVLFAVDYVLPSPSGKRSSSLATTPGGFAAWAELARRSGVDVVALRDELGEARLPAGSTVVALDVPTLSPTEAGVLHRHADSGGRVIVGGVRPERWLEVFDPGLRWDTAGRETVVAAGRELATAGAGSWDGGGILVERGNAVLLADATPLQNARLAEAENAAFALELAGDGPLVFAEAPHGYGAARGLAALPDAGKWALGLLLVAGALMMLARGRRLGPPEEPMRPLEPPRAAYVDALAAALARTRDPAGAMEPIRARLDAAPPTSEDEAIALARRHAETVS